MAPVPLHQISYSFFFRLHPPPDYLSSCPGCYASFFKFTWIVLGILRKHHLSAMGSKAGWAIIVVVIFRRLVVKGSWFDGWVFGRGFRVKLVVRYSSSLQLLSWRIDSLQSHLMSTFATIPVINLHLFRQGTQLTRNFNILAYFGIFITTPVLYSALIFSVIKPNTLSLRLLFSRISDYDHIIRLIKALNQAVVSWASSLLLTILHLSKDSNLFSQANTAIICCHHRVILQKR